eukprot:m.335469 g.335469  ORF g.335469 m.335469 type:complete len:224 (-) comp17602_c0_seq1:466-1137(-)
MTTLHSTHTTTQSDYHSKSVMARALNDCFAHIVEPAQLASIAKQILSAAVSLVTVQDSMPASPKQYKEELWYGALDFERFKREVIQEAIYAGHDNPRAQYQHIRRSFQDEVTLKNTELNVSLISSPEPPTEENKSNTQEIKNTTNEESEKLEESKTASPEQSPARPRHGRRASDGGASPTHSILTPSKRRGHKRSVSFDFDRQKRQQELGLAMQPMPISRSLT